MEKQVNGSTGSSPARIVVVEDDPDVSSLLGLLVRNFGYELCGTADNGEEAIGIIRKTAPDIVFVDIVLGGSMNGVELARILNRDFHIPFIYITAYSEEHLIEQVIHTAPAAFILKPFKGEEIRVAVELILKRKGGKR